MAWHCSICGKELVLRTTLHLSPNLNQSGQEIEVKCFSCFGCVRDYLLIFRPGAKVNDANYYTAFMQIWPDLYATVSGIQDLIQAPSVSTPADLGDAGTVFSRMGMNVSAKDDPDHAIFRKLEEQSGLKPILKLDVIAGFMGKGYTEAKAIQAIDKLHAKGLIYSTTDPDAPNQYLRSAMWKGPGTVK